VLDQDDGRPLFLFVQTYRTHQPYRFGPAEDTTRLLELTRRVQRARGGRRGLEARIRAQRAHVHELRQLYLEGAQALDASLEAWFRGLEFRGWLEPGFFLFTSDHGEAFFEHDRL
jgi:hypothetical protein